jgi:hypothetical protein
MLFIGAIVLANGRAIFQRRETTKAVQRLGNGIREGNEETLAADVTTGKGRMRGLASESQMIPEQHCCSLFAETGLRRIG